MYYIFFNHWYLSTSSSSLGVCMLFIHTKTDSYLAASSAILACSDLSKKNRSKFIIKLL